MKKIKINNKIKLIFYDINVELFSIFDKAKFIGSIHFYQNFNVLTLLK
jgi:hypothetical protein